MDLAVLEHSAPIPPDVDAGLWLRYLRGAKAFDQLWQAGQRCPQNPHGARCKCRDEFDGGRKEICKYWMGLEKLAREVGGVTATMVRGMT